MTSSFFKWFKKSYISLVLLIIYIPLVMLVVWSFVNPSEHQNVVMNPSEGGWGWGSYIELFKNNEFLNGLMNTFIIVSIVAPISVIIAVFTCYAIWNNRKTINTTTNFIARISIVNPEIITGVSLTILLTSTWIAIGLNFGYFTIILSHISFCTPYALITIYPRMAKFNKNLLDASNDLGYSSIKTFFKIVIPYLMPVIIGALALVIVMSFDDFIITNLVRGRVNTISTEMYLMAKGIKAWAIAFGALLVIIFITFIAIKSIFVHYQQKHKNHSNKPNIFSYAFATVFIIYFFYRNLFYKFYNQVKETSYENDLIFQAVDENYTKKQQPIDPHLNNAYIVEQNEIIFDAIGENND